MTVEKEDVADDTASKKEEKKFVYQGEIVDAISLVGQSNVPCEVVEIDVPAVGSNGMKSKASKLSSLIVVNSVGSSQFGKGTLCINYTRYLGDRKFQLGSVNVNDDFKLKRLTGKQGVKMLAAIEGDQIANLHKNLAHNFHVGSDPEIFVEDKNGVLIPAFTFLASKESKKNKTAYGKLVYFDGSAAEFETQAGSCVAYQVDSIQAGLKAVYLAARETNKDARLTLKTVMEVPAATLQSAAENCIVFGCLPSKNAYGLEGKKVPPRELPFRSTGGHLHFGVGKKDEETYIRMVKALDAILGVCSVSLFAKADNPIRRQFYGMAGEYRTPDHGLEYRALSSSLLAHPMITHLMFELAVKALVFGEKGYLKYWNAREEEIVNCVQNCDVDLAHSIMERNKPILLNLFKAAYPYLGDDGLERAYKLFYEGMETAVKDPMDVEANWRLNGIWTNHSGAANSTCETA